MVIYVDHKLVNKKIQDSLLREESLISGLVIAGCPAGNAVHQAVGAEPNIELRLAEDAELLAKAAGFDLFALCATDLGSGWFARHGGSLVLSSSAKNVTKVTTPVKCRPRALVPGNG